MGMACGLRMPAESKTKSSDCSRYKEDAADKSFHNMISPFKRLCRIKVPAIHYDFFRPLLYDEEKEIHKKTPGTRGSYCESPILRHLY